MTAPFDLSVYSPEERAMYRALGGRFDPEDALAQASLTLGAASRAALELMAHDFLLEDQATLRAARAWLDELHHGGGDGPVDPDAVPVLTGIVITVAREAEKAALDVARATYHASDSLEDVVLSHSLRMVAKPREGTEPAKKGADTVQALVALMSADDQRARALRELRRDRERRGPPPPPPRVALPTAAYRAAPAGHHASATTSDPAAPTLAERAWALERDASATELRAHGRAALKAVALLAFGFGGLVVASQHDHEQPSRATTRLAAMGAVLTVVAFFGLTRALVRLAVEALRHHRIQRRAP